MKESKSKLLGYPDYYDAQIHLAIPQYELFQDAVINLVKALPVKPMVWLDTGCGTGRFVEKAVKIFPETLFVLSDPSPEMLEQARRKLSMIPEKRIKFLKPMPTEDLTPKIAGNPDVLTAFLSHHYLKKDEREKATKTCRSLLKPGGLYVTFENIRPSTKKGLEAGMNSWRRFQLSQGRDEKSVEKHLKRYDTKYFPITVEEHIALLKRCGFKVCELLWYSCLQGGFYGIK